MVGMTAPAPTRLITAEEFLHMPESRGAELVDGRIVEKHRGVTIEPMTAPAPTRLITAEEFLHMPENRGAELVDGRIVEKYMGNESSWLGSEILILIGVYVRERMLGRVFGSDNGVAIWPSRPGKVRKPDVTFVARGKMPGDVPVKGWQTVVPDLVVEVVSPGDEAEDLETKLTDYREAGVPLIWVVFPGTRSAQVLTQTQRLDVRSDGALDGGEVLPGFSLSLGELFKGLEG